MSIREVADETGIKKSTVHNLKKKIDAGEVGHLSNQVSVNVNGCPTVQAPKGAGRMDSQNGAIDRVGHLPKPVSNGNPPALGPDGHSLGDFDLGGRW